MIKILTIGGVLLLGCIGIGTGVYIMKQTAEIDTAPQVMIVPPESKSLPTPERVAGKGTIESLLALRKTLECSFRTTTGTTTTEGTAFFDNGHMRVDTMYQGAGAVETSSFIMTNGILYTWADTAAGSFAVKVPVSDMQAFPSGESPGGVALTDTVQYECKSWNVDGSVFAPPPTITFKDMTGLIKNFPGSEGEP